MAIRAAIRLPINTLRSGYCRRPFFTFPPSFGSFVSNGGGANSVEDGMQTYHERKIMPYSRRQLYQLVADVDSYRHFIPFCNSSTVLKSSRLDWKTNPGKDGDPSTHLEAELSVGFLGFDERYVSNVECTPLESVQAIAATSTPLFKELITTWRFQKASSNSPHSTSVDTLSRNLAHSKSTSKSEADGEKGPTLLTFDISFAFANPLHATISRGFFGRVSSMMVTAFEQRCLEVYGEGKL